MFPAPSRDSNLKTKGLRLAPSLRSNVFNVLRFGSSGRTRTYNPIRFENCEFEHLEVGDDFSFAGVTFCDCQMHGLTVSRGHQAVDWYDPLTI